MTAPAGRSAASGRPAAAARTVFFGSGAFAVPILAILVAHPAVEVVAVVAPPDKPAGRHGRPRPVPVAAEARRLRLPLLQPERVRAPETAAAIEALAPDLGVLADFGRIVPGSILGIPRHGILNVHPSLLPRHRGATPVPATILAGDHEAGVTVMRMDEGLDTGPIVGARRWLLDGGEAAPQLERAAASEGAALLDGLLEPYLRGALVPTPQPAAGATLTRPLRRDDGRLDGSRPAEELARAVRAYEPWPGTFLDGPDGRLAVLRAAAGPSQPGDEPGRIVADADGLALTTTDGRLRLLEVKPAGGRTMDAAAYRRGHPTAVGQPVSGSA